MIKVFMYFTVLEGFFRHILIYICSTDTCWECLGYFLHFQFTIHCSLTFLLIYFSSIYLFIYFIILPLQIFAVFESQAVYIAWKCHTTRHIHVSRDFNSGLSSSYMEKVSRLVARKLFTDALQCVPYIIFYGHLVQHSTENDVFPVRLLPQLHQNVLLWEIC